MKGGKVVLTFESVDEILQCDHSNEATEQYFPVVLFITLYYKVILTFESVNEILKCDHISNESYWTLLSFGTVYFAVQGGSNFWFCGWNPEVWPFKWKLLSSNFLWYCLLCCKFSLWTKSYGVTIQIKPLWYHFHVELSSEQQWFSTFLQEKEKKEWVVAI